MPDWMRNEQKLREAVRYFLGLASRREGWAFGAAAALFSLGLVLPGFLVGSPVDAWTKPWHGVPVLRVALYGVGVLLLIFAVRREWLLARPAEGPPVIDSPPAIKGPLPFGPGDGALFRKLGREDQVRELLGYVLDDQVPLVVLMGMSGAGKTSLLRAGLSDVLKDRDVDYCYWEAQPTRPEERLLRAIQAVVGGSGKGDDAFPSSLDDLIDPPPARLPKRLVVVMDQFEQLRGRAARCPVFRLLRNVAREAQPPHRVTWFVAFRDDFAADWLKFLAEESKRKPLPSPPTVVLGLFGPRQAREVAGRLVSEAGLSVHQKVIDDLVAAATVEGEVSPVDLGTGLLVLSDLHGRQKRTLTLEDYRLTGGAEGLLKEYVARLLKPYPERETLVAALLGLADEKTGTRVAEGRTASELAAEVKLPADGLRLRLDRLAQRDARLLEPVEREDGEAAYRLAHERLIPALHRLTGRLGAEVDRAKATFDTAFRDWRNRERQSRYLLHGKELKLVERHRKAIDWERDTELKRAFLRRSRGRRVLWQVIQAGVAVVLLVGAWLGWKRHERSQAEEYLTRHGYPAALYAWQDQLEVLSLREPLDLTELSWCRSNTLRSLSLTPETGSITGMAEAGGLSGLSRLTLVAPSNADLSPLTALTDSKNLSQLILDLHGGPIWEVPADLVSLEKLTNLSHLEITINFGEAPDLSPLANLKGLKTLTIVMQFIPDLTPIVELPLKTLSLQGNSIDLSPLQGHETLTDVTLTSSDRNLDLRPLTTLKRLTRLRLNCHELDLKPLEGFGAETRLSLTMEVDTDPAQFANLKSLEKLTLSDTSDLAPLAEFPHLTELSFYAQRGTDLSPLVKMKRLARLEVVALDQRAIRDLTPLQDLNRLTALGIWVDEGADLTPLARLTRLPRLTIETAGAADLSPLVELKGLTELNLEAGGGPDLAPLEGLRAETRLNLTAYGADPASLAKLKSLRKLTLTVDGTPDLAPLAKLPHLTELALTVSGGVDLSPLETFQSLTVLSVEGATPSERTSLRVPPSLRSLSF